jgi:MscS family membrane protein
VTLARAQVELPSLIHEAVPESLRIGDLFGLQYWQWIALLLLIFLGVVVDQVTRLVFRPIFRKGARSFHPEVEDDTIAGAVRGAGLFAGALVWLALVRLLSLSGNTREIAHAATAVYAVLTGTLFGLRIIDLVADVFVHLAGRTETKFDDIVVPLLRKTAKVFIFAFGVIYGAQNLRINIVPLITGLGIGGLAFAFAAKDTIENFFGSIAVLMDRPFEVGDWVVIEGVEGTVEEMGLRSTRIRTFYNSQVTVPNASLVRANVDNYGRRVYRRWKTYLGVQYDTPPEKLLAFTEGIRELVRQHPYTRKDFYQVWCSDFADFSLSILLYVFFHVPDWATELRERERLFVDIVRLADRLGVVFAFPTQTVHLYKEEHAPHESAYTVPKGAHDDEAARTGLEAARAITASRPWQGERPGPVHFNEWLESSKDRGGDG